MYRGHILHWMVSDRLLLNDEKTEFLLIDTSQQLAKVDPLPLKFETMDIEAVNCIGNLGASLATCRKANSIQDPASHFQGYSQSLSSLHQ